MSASSVVLAAAWNLRAEGEGTDPSTRQFTQAGTFLRDAPGPGRILGPWTWGHLLHLVSRRGVVIDGFGTMPGAIPFENALSALLATDERVTADYCASVGVRWVVLENPLRLIPPIAATTGRRADAFLRAGPTKDAPPLVTRRALASFWWRAYYDRGRARPEAGRFGRPLTGFRLAWESAERAGEPAPFDGPAVQVWELVGGRAEPGG